MNWLRVVVMTLLVAAPAGADVLRPLDERATARLMVAELAKVKPDAQFEVSRDGTSVIILTWRGEIRSSSSTRRRIWKETAELHAMLRAEPDGNRREEILVTYIADEMAKHEQDERKGAEMNATFDELEQIETATILPLLHDPNVGPLSKAPFYAHLPFVDGLVVYWVQDRKVEFPLNGGVISKVAHPLSPADVKKAGLDKLKLSRAGLVNLEARLSRVVEKQAGRFVTLSLDGRFGASLMLLSSYWERMAQDGRLLTVAIPREDELILIADATEAEIAELRDRARETRSYCYVCGDRVSAELYRWTSDGWQLLPE